MIQALIEVGVVGDYREPGICRFGFAPLYLTLEEVDQAVDRLVEVMIDRGLAAVRHDRTSDGHLTSSVRVRVGPA